VNDYACRSPRCCWPELELGDLLLTLDSVKSGEQGRDVHTITTRCLRGGVVMKSSLGICSKFGRSTELAEIVYALLNSCQDRSTDRTLMRLVRKVLSQHARGRPDA
jgi:hypothetical protein